MNEISRFKQSKDLVHHFPKGDYKFQDDNALVHRAGVTYQKLKNHIQFIVWSTQRLDLNIFGNVWYRLTRELKSNEDKVNSN